MNEKSVIFEANISTLEHYAEMMNEFRCNDAWTEKDGCCSDSIQDEFWEVLTTTKNESRVTVTVSQEVAEFIEWIKEQDKEAWEEHYGRSYP